MRKLVIMAISLLISAAGMAQGNAGAKNMEKETERFAADPGLKILPLHRGTGLYDWFFKYTYPHGKEASGKLPKPLARLEKAFADNARHASLVLTKASKEIDRPFERVSFSWPDEAWGSVRFGYAVDSADTYRYLCFDEGNGVRTSYMLTWKKKEHTDSEGSMWMDIDGCLVKLSGTHWQMGKIGGLPDMMRQKEFISGLPRYSDEYVNLREQLFYLGQMYTECTNGNRQADCDAVAYVISKLTDNFKERILPSQFKELDKVLSGMIGITPDGSRLNLLLNARNWLEAQTANVPDKDLVKEVYSSKDLPLYDYTKLLIQTRNFSKFEDVAPFKISGTTGKNVHYVSVYDSRMLEDARHAAPVKNGKFSFTVKVNKDNPVTITDGEGHQWRLMADGVPVVIDLRTGVQSGSATNMKLGECQARFKKIIADKAKYITTANGMSQVVDEEGYNALCEKLKQAEVEAIRNCNDAKAAACLLADRYPAMDYEELDGILNGLREYADSELLRPAKDYLEAMKKRRPGMKYVDIALEDTAGVMQNLSQYVGKGYVILNFWEEWSGVSREDFPLFKRLLARYGDKGLTIVSVVIGTERGSWKHYVKKRGLKWTHLRTALDYDGRSVLDRYGVRCLPENVLIGPDGRIVASGLYGPGLEKKIESIFNR